MHNLSGHSQFYDRIRRVHLANAVDLEVMAKQARLLIGPASGLGAKELIVFNRPGPVSTCSIIAQVLEECGTAAANQGVRIGNQTWMPCTDCQQRGGIFDSEESWLSCGRCHGTGIIRITG